MALRILSSKLSHDMTIISVMNTYHDVFRPDDPKEFERINRHITHFVSRNDPAELYMKRSVNLKKQLPTLWIPNVMSIMTVGGIVVCFFIQF